MGKEIGDIIFSFINFEDCSMVISQDLIDGDLFERVIDDPWWNAYSKFIEDENDTINGLILQCS